MSHELLGAQLRRVDAPWPDLLALSVAGRGLRGVLLIGLAPAARGVGFVERRPVGRASSPFLLQTKRCLEGGRLAGLERPDATSLRLIVERKGARHALEALLRGTRGNAALRGPGGELIAALDANDPRLAALAAAGSGAALEELAILRERGAELLGARTDVALEQQRAQLARDLRDAERRLERRLLAIEQDRARAEQVPELRRHGGLLLTHLHALGPAAAGTVELLDEGTDPPERVAIAIDPMLGPQRQAQALFDAARKLERGAAIALERARATRTQLEPLRELAQRVARAQDAAELEQLSARASEIGLARAARAAPGRRKSQPARQPYRTFAGSGGRAILVGRGKEDNDRLTLDHTRPHDLWLHARDDAGAHVVVRLERGEACPSELLCDAATLAAHFSQARGQPRVDVIYTERRYVRKPRKSPAGRVLVEREKVFPLRLEPDRLRRLLEAER